MSAAPEAESSPSSREASCEAGLDGFPVVSRRENLSPPETLEALVSRFTEQVRSGGALPVEEYVRRYPQWAEEIRELFPAVLALEEWKLEKEADCLRKNVPKQFQVHQLGNCRLLREIGRGGMGVVFEAVEERLQQRVAVKLLPWRYGAAVLRWREQFEAETRTIARLEHPQIIPVLGVGEQDGYWYYLMPLIEGVGLDWIIHRLQENGTANYIGEIQRRWSSSVAQQPADESIPPAARLSETSSSSSSVELPESDTNDSPNRAEPVPAESAEHPVLQRNSWRDFARMMYQAARAVAFAHQRGVLHNDIKPANILLDARGRVKMGDFGLARSTDAPDAEPVSRIAGTLRYMAPERLAGVCNPRSDVYSLGATLYELTTQTPAFNDADRSRVMEEIAAGRYPAPREIHPAFPRPLETIILTAMATDSARRYVSAEAMASDLLRFANGRPLQSRRSSLLRWLR